MIIDPAVQGALIGAAVIAVMFALDKLSRRERDAARLDEHNKRLDGMSADIAGIRHELTEKASSVEVVKLQDENRKLIEGLAEMKGLVTAQAAAFNAANTSNAKFQGDVEAQLRTILEEVKRHE